MAVNVRYESSFNLRFLICLKFPRFLEDAANKLVGTTRQYQENYYIGRTVRNLSVRIGEHSNPAHTSEPAKHLRENPLHSSLILSLGVFSPQYRHSTSVGSLRG